jgi:hypothetical protein
LSVGCDPLIEFRHQPIGACMTPKSGDYERNTDSDRDWTREQSSGIRPGREHVDGRHLEEGIAEHVEPAPPRPRHVPADE